MKLLSIILMVSLLACGHHTSDKQVDKKDSSAIITDSLPPAGNITDSIAAPTQLASTISGLLKNKYSEEWILVNDFMANWPKDEFDYFIAPKRKTEPDYPYIATGDFNGDGQEDAAVLAVKSGTKEYQVFIISDYTSATPSFYSWKEDIDVTALSRYPKGELDGINGEKIKMEGDGIGIEYYEKSSFVLYWTGNKFKRVWTGD